MQRQRRQEKKKPKNRGLNIKKKCRFCRSKNGLVDYKDVNTIRKLTTLHGKIFSRKRSGNCARHQRQLKTAVKRARYLGLL